MKKHLNSSPEKALQPEGINSTGLLNGQFSVNP